MTESLGGFSRNWAMYHAYFQALETEIHIASENCSNYQMSERAVPSTHHECFAAIISAVLVHDHPIINLSEMNDILVDDNASAEL